MACPDIVFAPQLALVLTGCAEQLWPAVSRENCQPPQTVLIKGFDRRAEFIGIRSSTPGTAWPRHPDKCFALSDANRAFFVQTDPRARRLGDTPNPLDWLSIQP